MRASHQITTVLGGLLVVAITLDAGQQAPPAATYAPRQSDRPTPVPGDEPGFQPIFDGKTLSGWEGDPKYWRVEDGVAGRRNHAGDGRQEQHVHHLAGRPAEGLRAEAGLPHHRGRKQRHQLPQRERAGSGDARQQVRAARLSVRFGRRETLRRQQLRREGPAVRRRAGAGDAHRRRPAAGRALHDRGSGGDGGGRRPTTGTPCT